MCLTALIDINRFVIYIYIYIYTNRFLSFLYPLISSLLFIPSSPCLYLFQSSSLTVSDHYYCFLFYFYFYFLFSTSGVLDVGLLDREYASAYVLSGEFDERLFVTHDPQVLWFVGTAKSN